MNSAATQATHPFFYVDQSQMRPISRIVGHKEMRNKELHAPHKCREGQGTKTQSMW